MKETSKLHQETAEYFRRLEQDKSAAQNAYRYIIITMDDALVRKDYSMLEKLIPYIECGDGHLAFQYIGKTHRFLRMLNIIALENKYRRLLFCKDCNSANALWERYMLTLFAFRRLLFQLSASSTEDAVIYLRSHPMSHFAAYTITQDERLLPNRELYKTIATIYLHDWSLADLQQFYTLADLS